MALAARMASISEGRLDLDAAAHSSATVRYMLGCTAHLLHGGVVVPCMPSCSLAGLSPQAGDHP